MIKRRRKVVCECVSIKSLFADADAWKEAMRLYYGACKEGDRTLRRL
jgi:hypothetical protein